MAIEEEGEMSEQVGEQIGRASAISLEHRIKQEGEVATTLADFIEFLECLYHDYGTSLPQKSKIRWFLREQGVWE